MTSPALISFADPVELLNTVHLKNGELAIALQRGKQGSSRTTCFYDRSDDDVKLEDWERGRRMTKIVILGWGSLLWDKNKAQREFDKHRGSWKFDGPVLKLEFSRKSAKRLNALTLVIDPIRGEACRVAYALSKRRTIEKAVADLQTREETGPKNIGCVFADGSRRQGRDSDSIDAILQWALRVSLDVVLWTDLPGDFDNVPKNKFVKAAVDYVQRLPAKAKAMAAEYVWRAPGFIVTPVRSALQAEPWFSKRRPIAFVGRAKRK